MAISKEKLESVYKYVENYVQEYGFAPSVRDICADLNIKSTATAYLYLNRLIEQGLINKATFKKRAISLKNNASSISVPLIGTITAGAPIFATENFEGYYAIPKEFESNEETFMLTVKGESMINAGILDGDKIIVKKQDSCDNGDIVVALIDDSATVKRFYKKENKIYLHPENDNMQDIIVDNVAILGIVTGLIRKF